MKKRTLLIALTLCAFAALTQVISQEVANPEIGDDNSPTKTGAPCYQTVTYDQDKPAVVDCNKGDCQFTNGTPSITIKKCQ